MGARNSIAITEFAGTGAGRTVLLVAYHYPPCAESSGLQRSLSFSIHLREHGWRPIVLSASPASYQRLSDGQLADIPRDVRVVRTWAPDIARHLAIGGRYWSRLALPDRWRAWWLTAVPRALQVVRRENVDVVWSTYPIATAHTIAATVSQRARLPWVADFRDPMVELVARTGETFPKDPALRRSRLRIETLAARQAARLVFCTESAREIVAERYPNLPRSRLEVISNGFEEQAFRDAEAMRIAREEPLRRVLLHSGTIYRSEDRDPRNLFAAIRMLADSGQINPRTFVLRLRAPSSDDYFHKLAHEFGISALVSVVGPVPYRSALSEMLAADGLLLLQGQTSNPAVPAKLYEYLRAGKAIIALIDAQGETAALLRRLGLDAIAPLTDASRIAALVGRWAAAPDALRAGLPPRERVAEFSRAGLTERLAGVLDAVTAQQAYHSSVGDVSTL